MSALTCGCTGDCTENEIRECTASATQEDLLCDWCRARDCPTVTWDNVVERDRRAMAATARVAF